MRLGFTLFFEGAANSAEGFLVTFSLGIIIRAAANAMMLLVLPAQSQNSKNYNLGQITVDVWSKGEVYEVIVKSHNMLG